MDKFRIFYQAAWAPILTFQFLHNLIQFFKEYSLAAHRCLRVRIRGFLSKICSNKYFQITKNYLFQNKLYFEILIFSFLYFIIKDYITRFGLGLFFSRYNWIQGWVEFSSRLFNKLGGFTLSWSYRRHSTLKLN